MYINFSYLDANENDQSLTDSLITDGDEMISSKKIENPLRSNHQGKSSKFLFKFYLTLKNNFFKHILWLSYQRNSKNCGF